MFVKLNMNVIIVEDIPVLVIFYFPTVSWTNMQTVRAFYMVATLVSYHLVQRPKNIAWH